ncbi:hypothetical protein DF185_06690 [Marinifilum breve]|uniref:Thioredoxin domain-containing protein n=2 Tax=Marinifilum breve TaxID=2184082 RepID=A0A2V4A0S1_9BACT|nr:hypothetical protein DF185_06690 [Marinifilum breve]
MKSCTKHCRQKKTFMKQIWVFFLILGTSSCTVSHEQVLEETKNNLTSEKGMAYDINQILIQGNPSTADTTIVHTTTHAIFEYNKQDSLINFKYSIEDQYTHPIFQVSVKSKSYYDWHKHVKVLESELKNMKKETCHQEIEASTLERDTRGHISTVLKIINKDEFKFKAVNDTIFKDKKCICIKAISEEDISHHLIIDKEMHLPVRLQIIESFTQPFINEYNYYNFREILDFKEASFESVMPYNEFDAKPLTVGDVIPEWSLKYVDNKKISTSDFKGKSTILFLSAINCGWCQKAIPSISRIQQKYRENDSIQTFVFYPLDTKEKLESYIQVKKIDFPIIYNPGENNKERIRMLNRLKFSYPTTIILNCNNEIVWYKTGYGDGFEELIEKSIQKYL